MVIIVNTAFLQSVMAAKVIIQAVLMRIYLMIKTARMLCYKSKNINGCQQYDKVKDCDIDFFSSDENDAKGLCFVHKEI